MKNDDDTHNAFFRILAFVRTSVRPDDDDDDDDDDEGLPLFPGCVSTITDACL
jgi:hypothetical protein